MQYRGEFTGSSYFRLAVDGSIDEQQRGFLDFQSHVLGNVGQRRAVPQIFLDPGGEFGNCFAPLFVAKFFGDFGAGLIECLAGSAFRSIDPDQ